ncbi:calcium-binding protein [Opitutaceae bacterium TAV5]|nr:calcium-binding protein [Opitutaceae bacterium TAV5]
MNTSRTTRLFATLAILAAAFTTVAHADPVSLTGDHVIEPGPDDTGSLTVSGQLHVESNHVDLGTTGDGQVALSLTYQENGETRQVTVYAARDAVEYLWKEGSTDAGTASPKMTLGADNTLTLHDAAGAATITLTPSTGEVRAPGGFRLSDGTLIANQASLRSTALYNAAGQIVAQVGEDGRVSFANGIAIGQNPTATLTEGSTSYLNTVLQNLGYQENPVTPTHVKGAAVPKAKDLVVVYDTTGNQYVAGAFSGSSLTIGNATIWADSDVGEHQFVVKCTSSGAVLWYNVWSADGAPLSMAVDTSGNVYVSGYFYSVAGQTLSLAGVSVTAQGTNDGYVLKLNSAGTGQWAKVLGHTGNDQAHSVAVDASGNIYVAGYFYRAAGQTLSLAGVSVTAQDPENGYVLKLNNAGVGQWAQSLSYSSYYNSVPSVAVDPLANVYITGGLSSSVVQTISLAGIPVIAQTQDDSYMLKLNSAGAGQWVKVIPASSLRLSFPPDGTLTATGCSSQNFMIGNMAVGGSGTYFIVSMPADQAPVEAPRPMATSIAWGNAVAAGASTIAVGDNAIATGRNAVSLGLGAAATGRSTIALGEHAVSTGDGAIALGEYASAVGYNAIAFSGSNTASGEGSFAAGAGNIASGDYSFIAGGYGSTTSGRRSVSVGGFDSVVSGLGSVILGGESNNVSGDYSFVAAGWGTIVSGYSSAAIGVENSASGNYTAAFGEHIQSQASNLFAIGRRNVPQGNKTAWIPTDDLFVVGNGDSNTGDSNAAVIHKNGTLRSSGYIESKLGIRIPPGGDIPMGTFTQGNDPRALDAGLRYENE